MKIAARILVVLTMIVSVLALTTATSNAASSKDDGYCLSRVVPTAENGVSQATGKLKHKFNNNGKNEFDLKCQGDHSYFRPGTYTDALAYKQCVTTGFAGDDYYFGNIPGKIVSAKLKVNANGKYTLKCSFDARYGGPGCDGALRDGEIIAC